MRAFAEFEAEERRRAEEGEDPSARVEPDVGCDDELEENEGFVRDYFESEDYDEFDEPSEEELLMASIPMEHM